MPRAKANAASTPVEPVKPVEHEEQVELEDSDDIEEDVEYEEIEEEIEEEEEVEEEEDDLVENGAEGEPSAAGKQNMNKDFSADEIKEHAELLALPPHGSEVYVGSIPHEASEEDIKAFFGTVGEVIEVRIMKTKDGLVSKGYGFVAYKTKEFASKAIEELDNKEFKGKRIKVSTSQAKNKLFIGNIPKTWSEDEIKEVVTGVGPGVTLVQLVKDSQSGRNRGYAFVEYYNHPCAEYSRKKMSSKTGFKLDNKTPTVSWADGKGADTNVQVKAVYVKNLPKDVTQNQLKELFQCHGEIVKVILPPAKSGHEKSRYGFVHFAEKSMAMNAVNETEKYELDGQVLECSLAKPPSEKKSDSVPNSKKPILPAYTPSYGLMSAGYGIGGNFAVAPFSQPVMYGRGIAPSGVAMVPMVLPDGRLGYVLQQPGYQLHSHSREVEEIGRATLAGPSKAAMAAEGVGTTHIKALMGMSGYQYWYFLLIWA